MELRIIFDKLQRCFKTNQIDSSKHRKRNPTNCAISTLKRKATRGSTVIVYRRNNYQIHRFLYIFMIRHLPILFSFDVIFSDLNSMNIGFLLSIYLPSFKRCSSPVVLRYTMFYEGRV